MGTTGEYKEAIKALRASTGLSQKAFAEKFDIPKRTIENWEGGQTDPPGYVVKLIEKSLEAEQAQGEAIALEEVKTEVHTYKVTGSELKQDFRIDIVAGTCQGYDTWDIWYYTSDCPEKGSMWGVPRTTPLSEVLDMVKANFDEDADTFLSIMEDHEIYFDDETGEVL